jgi:hypothetical protein
MLINATDPRAKTRYYSPELIDYIG